MTSGAAGNRNSKYDLSVFLGIGRPKLNSFYYYEVEEDRAFSQSMHHIIIISLGIGILVVLRV